MAFSYPAYLSTLFCFITFATLLLFLWAVKKSSTWRNSGALLFFLSVWLVIQAVLSSEGVYYQDRDTLPPKILVFGIAPSLLTIILLFATPGGKRWIDRLSLVRLTWLHMIRIPVEIVLFVLFLYEWVPQLMTFEGRNFDILAGLTAPFIACFGLIKGKLSNRFILLWNLISLALLLNIVIHGFLSAPSPLQRLAFDQPNIAILYFPFCWLPTFIVPIVLFSHLAAIRQLTLRQPLS